MYTQERENSHIQSKGHQEAVGCVVFLPRFLGMSVFRDLRNRLRLGLIISNAQAVEQLQ